jgi:CheY-like chemotaxis protein
VPEAGSQPIKEAAVARPVHIIIADDEDGIRLILSRIVAQLYPHATISALSDGLEALAAYDQRGADLVITNQSMPQMDGVQLIAAIRSRSINVPILMVSGDTHQQRVALAAGASAFLAKPFKRAQFVQTLLSLLPP